MKVAIMQPYFYPYLGYYQLISECDSFVFLDNVNFIKKGFIHKNFINVNGGKSQISLRLSKASQNKKINELIISDSTSDFLNKVEECYKKSPHWEDVSIILEKYKLEKHDSLSEFLININCHLISCLNLHAKVLKASDIPLEFNEARGEDRILQIIKAIGGTNYINLPGGKDLYSKNNFEQNNIELNFLEPNLKLDGSNENSFSIIDCVANYGFSYLEKWFSRGSLK